MREDGCAIVCPHEKHIACYGGTVSRGMYVTAGKRPARLVRVSMLKQGWDHNGDGSSLMTRVLRFFGDG